MTSSDPETFLPSADAIITYNRDTADENHDPALQVLPTRKLAIVGCMDSRVDTFQILGLARGEAHIIRNAGGVITDDVIRSLCLSQRLMGTREIILLHHTDCGLQRASEDEFKAEIQAELGVKPWWSLESFKDPYVDVEQSMKRLELTPFIPHKDNIRGFVYDVKTGMINEVNAADS